jgi:hypothetical protein
LAKDLKFAFIPTDLNLGGRRGDDTQMEWGPFSRESGSDRLPGSPIRSTKYSLIRKMSNMIKFTLPEERILMQIMNAQTQTFHDQSAQGMRKHHLYCNTYTPSQLCMALSHCLPTSACYF